MAKHRKTWRAYSGKEDIRMLLNVSPESGGYTTRVNKQRINSGANLPSPD